MPGSGARSNVLVGHSPRPDHDGLGAVREAVRPERVGVALQVRGLSVQVRGLDGAVGDVVTLDGMDAEVVAVGEGGLRCMPLGAVSGLTVGAPVRGRGGPLRVPTGTPLLGRVLDGLGRPIDGKGPLQSATEVSLDHAPPSIMGRDRIDSPLPLGVRALDTLVSVGRGQRVGLFAGSGVGKSSLLSMIARGTDAEVTVIALVGERGREVREFIEDDLGPEGLARSVVVVSTSDQPAMARIRAAYTATRIAEAFRDDGAHAILMMDSLTRVAMAQREIGLSAGEPPPPAGIHRRPSRSSRASSNARAPIAVVRSPASTPCSWTATTTTNRSRTPCDRSSTVMSCWIGPSRCPDTIRRSTCSARSPVWRARSLPPDNGRTRRPCVPCSPRVDGRTT